MKEHAFSKRTIAYWLTALVVVAIVGASFAMPWDSIKHEFTLATTRQPERLTELFFNNPTQIPSSAKAGQVIPMSFTIHNLEAHDQSYHYKATVKSGDAETLLKDAKIDIKDGETKLVPQDFIAPQTKGRAEFVVLLADQNQSIHFWLDIH